MNLSDEQLKDFSEKIKRDDFAAQLNTKFRVDQKFDVKLIEVSEAKIYPRQEFFSILFLMPDDFPLEQKVCSFEHPHLGTNELFIVPIERDSEGTVFEVVFNRRLSKN